MGSNGKIYSFDALCPEIGGKNRKSFPVEDEKVISKSSSQCVDSPSTAANICIKGVYFTDLDYTLFNPSADPEPENCFNCWEKGHSRKECPKPKRQDFCYNCGRRDVRVSSCPRCSRAYAYYWKKTRKERRRDGQFFDDSIMSFESEKNKEDSKEELENLTQSVDNDLDHEGEGVSSNESGYYEDIVVDEDTRSFKFTGGFLEDFLNLMDAIKHLPIETQNTVILRFVEDRRKLMNDRNIVAFVTPYLHKIWGSCQSLLSCANEYGRLFVGCAYKLGRDFISKFL